MSYFKSKIPYVGSNFRAIPIHQTIVAINPEKKNKNKTKQKQLQQWKHLK